MNKQLEQKSPAKPESITNELSDEQLGGVSVGTRKIDKASVVLTTVTGSSNRRQD